MPVRSVFVLLLAAACGLRSGLAIEAQQLPVTHGKALSGRAVTLPVPDRPQTLVIAGFSKGSSAAVKAWSIQARESCKAHPAVACIDSAVIEDAPSFIRGMIISGMKQGMTAELQDRFVPIVENEAAWKQAFGFSAPDDAYLAIFDKTGKLLWRTSGGEKAANSAVIAQGFDSASK